MLINCAIFFFVISKVPKLGVPIAISIRQGSTWTCPCRAVGNPNDDNNVVPNFSPNVI